MAQDRILGYHQYDRPGQYHIEWHKVDAPTERSMFDGFHIGWEWELELGGESFNNAKKIVKALGHDITTTDMVVVAEDGSLTDGFEIISQPVNIGYMFNENGQGFDIPAACRMADDLGYSGQGVGSGRQQRGGHAGIHFNFSRDELGIHENAEHKFYCLLLNNYEWMYKKFSRRAGTNNEWYYCPFPEGHQMSRITPMTLRTDYEGTIERLQKLAHAGRTHSIAINTSKSSVIEVRFMCSTTYPEYFVGALQLMFMIAWAVRNMTIEQITAVNFPWFRQVANLNGFEDFLTSCSRSRIDVDELRFPV